MKTFKKILDITIGVIALTLMAMLIIYAFNFYYYTFMGIQGSMQFLEALRYMLPLLVAFVCIRFTCDKTVWLILTVIFVAFALWIYLAPNTFFNFIGDIF